MINIAEYVKTNYNMLNKMDMEDLEIILQVDFFAPAERKMDWDIALYIAGLLAEHQRILGEYSDDDMEIYSTEYGKNSSNDYDYDFYDDYYDS